MVSRSAQLDGLRPHGSSDDGDRRTSPPWLGWLAVVAVAALPVVEAVRIVVQRSHVVLFGDQALLELGARRAARLDQLVGPYSREGFHHPGPAVLYLLAPFVRILEPGGPGLYLGAIAISGAALIATVAYLWRRLGPLTALWAAAAIDLYCLCLRVGTLREPWNPYLVVTPMVLFVVLWAAGVTGSLDAGVWAVVIGSYEVQTHVATAGFVVTMTGILVASIAVSGRRGCRGRRGRRDRFAGRDGWGPARLTGAVALVLIWLAPVVELWRNHPNNLRLLWNFFTTPHPTPAFGQTLKVAATAVTIMPFGNRDYVQTLSRSGTELGIGAALLVIGLVVAGALGWRRRQPMSLALAASSVLGVVLGVISLTQTAGPVYLYFAVWLAYVPLSLLVSIGVALLAPAGAGSVSARRLARPVVGRAHSAVAVCVVAAVALAGLAVRSDLRMGPVKTTTVGGGPWPEGVAGRPEGRSQSRLDAIALTMAAEGVLRPTDRWVGFVVGTAGLWPYVAGIVLELDQRGVQSTVGPAGWELYFGHEREAGRPVNVTFDLYESSDTAAGAAAGGTVIAKVHGAVLTYQRASG